MKLLLREYVASLKERDELDAVLPDMLSEMGFHVYSRPGRGTNQYGVDVAAVGPDADGETKLFLLSIKRGDLTRAEWQAPEQGLRNSLEDILDVYIASHIPPDYAALKIVICLCFGGRMRETVRERVTAFTAKNKTDRISFQEWDDDRIAGMLATGILREEVLPKPLRSAFQKAVALVDEPDVSLGHFSKLLDQLHEAAQDPKIRLRSVRQIYLCLWILFVWARDADNLEAPYRASERALLTTWNLLKAYGPEDPEEQAVVSAFEQMIHLHMTVGETFLTSRILPHSKVRHGLSMAVGTNSAVDINLKLFEVVGRLAQSGIWLSWFRNQPELPADKKALADARLGVLCDAVLDLVEANPSLNLPIADHQATDLVSAFILFMAGGVQSDRINVWIGEMADRLGYAIRLHRRYTSSYTDYRDLVHHPRLRTPEYREEATAGSTLIPFLAAWFARVADSPRLERLARLTREELDHCTLQLWLPDEHSETHLYRNTDHHGRALTDLPVTEDGLELSAIIGRALIDHGEMKLTAADRCWPLVILACRHWRLPIPPQYWFPSLRLEDVEKGSKPEEK